MFLDVYWTECNRDKYWAPQKFMKGNKLAKINTLINDQWVKNTFLRLPSPGFSVCINIQWSELRKVCKCFVSRNFVPRMWKCSVRLLAMLPAFLNSGGQEENFKYIIFNLGHPSMHGDYLFSVIHLCNADGSTPPTIQCSTFHVNVRFISPEHHKLWFF